VYALCTAVQTQTFVTECRLPNKSYSSMVAPVPNMFKTAQTAKTALATIDREGRLGLGREL
jgi:hypothetical protein